MQSKLATWSTKDRERKFDRLLRLIADRNWLSEAARITLASSGARTPGVDGLDKRMMEVNLQHELATIREELLGGTYQPLPARRVYIPKTNGKLRPLGIPSLRDRIVERAMLMAMEPIWESDFHSASYGFRPARSVHHAIRMEKLQLQDGDERSTAGRWIIEGDLASYFDTVHHRLLIKGIRKRIADQRFLALLWKFIKAGSVDRGLFRAASEGVPQGGVITPLTQKVIWVFWLRAAVLRGTRRDGNAVPNGDGIFPHQNVFNQQPYDSLALSDSKRFSSAAQAGKECCEGLCQAQECSSIVGLVGDCLQLRTECLLALT